MSPPLGEIFFYLMVFLHQFLTFKSIKLPNYGGIQRYSDPSILNKGGGGRTPWSPLVVRPLANEVVFAGQRKTVVSQ